MKNLKSDIERYFLLAGKKTPISFFGFLFACLNPRLMPVALIRLSEWFYIHRLGPLSKLCSMLNVIFFGIEVSPKVKIGGGLFLPHTVGTVLGAQSIGANVTIMQGVTLGAKEPDMQFISSTRPVIGNDVLIGAGAKVIGQVYVGDFAKIGANAVVLTDVPTCGVAIGVPARVLIRQPRNDA